MDFERAEPVPAKFSVPDKITVRQQLAYYSACSGFGEDQKIERWWMGAVALIEPDSWKCELLPDIRNVSLDDLDDPNVTGIIIWASTQVRIYVSNLGTVSKN